MAISEVNRVTPNSVALVPVVVTPRRLAVVQGLTRPDPSFVTHLIAMAYMSPQTRSLRRAAPEDVQAAYRSVANQNRTVTPPGVRMRRMA
jgi:phosphatidate phosphatase APP1